MRGGSSASTDRALRVSCLALIVVQNSSLILVTSYSRSLTPAYLPTVAVYLSEVLKLLACEALLAFELRSVRGALRATASLLCEHGWATAKFAIPALCYTLQNNLWYYALSNLDPITAAVTSQMKVITTAVASVIMLGRRLTRFQWVSLVALTVGMVIMQLPAAASAAGHGQRHHSSHHQQRLVPHNTLDGALAMIASTVLSAYAGVYLEKLFKTVQLTLWLQSIQLSLFALPVAAATMALYDHTALLAPEGMWVGFNAWAWATVVLAAVGGIAVSMALK